MMEAKTTKSPRFEIAVPVKVPQVVYISPPAQRAPYSTCTFDAQRLNLIPSEPGLIPQHRRGSPRVRARPDDDEGPCVLRRSRDLMENVLDSDSLVPAGVEREMDSPGHLLLGALGTTDAAPKDYSSCDRDEDEVASTISELSALSDSSDLAGAGWERSSEISMTWVHQQMNAGADPRDLLERMLPDGALVPVHMDRLTMWKMVINMVTKDKPLRRPKLSHVNTLDDVVQLLRTCNRILVLTGAGVSVSCGIPDFRSRNGIYARLSKDFPTLPNPQAMFDIDFFHRDPRPFFKFAKEIYPGQFTPSASHRFIKLLEDNNKLLRNYTQNIDTLEATCGIRNVITCHGSFATASCTRCHYKVDCNVIKEDIFSQVIPFCPKCRPEDVEASGEMAVMKPDIVFFGEDLSREFYEAMNWDKTQCDLLIVMGSSLKVRPVALIPNSIPSGVPQVLINREPLNDLTFDVELLGDSDVIVKELCNRLNWDLSHNEKPVAPLIQLRHLPPASEVKEAAEKNAVAPENENEHVSTSRAVPADEVAADITCAEMASTSDLQDCSSNTPLKPTRESIASRLPEGHYLFAPPSRHIFPGAEVYADPEDSDSSGASFTAEEDEDLESDLESSSFNSDEGESLAQSFVVGSPSHEDTMDCEQAEQDFTAVITLPLLGDPLLYATPNHEDEHAFLHYC